MCFTHPTGSRRFTPTWSRSARLDILYDVVAGHSFILSRMKKLLSSLVVILIIMLILWAISGWYFGSKAEQEFKTLLQQSSQLAGKRFFRAELLHYKKTPSGAKASLGISSDYPALADRMGDLELQVKLLNGPVFFTRSGVSVGSSRWKLKVVDVTSDVNEEEQELKEYEDIFPNGLPSAVVRVEFDEKAHYESKFGTSFATLFVTGVFDLETQDNRGAISLKNFVFGNQPNVISSDNIQVSYQHQKAITTRYKPGTASLQATSLQIKYEQLLEPLVFDIKINSNISLENNALQGYLNADIHNISPDVGAEGIPVEKADVSFQFDGLPADALIAFSEANDELDNLHQQAQWALEELGEVPEGQDQIWKLYDRIEESTNVLPKILSEHMAEGLIRLKATTHYKGSSSQLDAKLKLESDNPKISSWLSLLKGEAQVELDEYLLEKIQKFLPITNANFQLLLKNNKVLMTQ